jgi:hypothetical protein
MSFVLVLTRQPVSGHQAGDTGAYDRDPHCGQAGYRRLSGPAAGLAASADSARF